MFDIYTYKPGGEKTNPCILSLSDRTQCAAVWEPERQNIYYSEAQTQMVRRPAVCEEMKCSLMLNMEGILSLHSHGFIIRLTQECVCEEGNTCTDANIIYLNRRA